MLSGDVGSENDTGRITVLDFAGQHMYYLMVMSQSIYNLFQCSITSNAHFVSLLRDSITY